MRNIYDGFTFVKALSLSNPIGILNNNSLKNKTEEIPFLHAVVEFRTVHKTYDGSFGFDWYRKKDNGQSYGITYKYFIKSGYKDGRTNLKPEEAINRFLDMYEEIPINMVSRKSQKERELRNYQVPYLSMFSKETVEAMKLPKEITQPQFSITLSAIVEIARNSVLEFEYDTTLFDVTPKTLADKSAEKGIRQSKTKEITITCKKDLDSNKEIRIYAYPQDKKYKKSLAGKITVLQNDDKVRKTVNFALVNVKTKIKDEEFTGNIQPKETDTLRKAMYQCLIMPHIFYDEKVPFDLSKDENFKIIKDNFGNDKYGKYICRNTSPDVKWTDGGIFHSSDYTDCHDYVKKLYISKNKFFLKSIFYKNLNEQIDEEYLNTNVFTVFAFQEDSFKTFRSPIFKDNHALEGEVKGIDKNTAMLFKSLYSTQRKDDTSLAHEVLHGLGVYHTHMDENPIPTSRILCTFEEKSTDNYMSYRAVESDGTLDGEERETLWRWQWKIANTNIPRIENDPQ
ncbi:hypothetical protein [Chryseobacterium oryctis]|uniref:Uncharacterized protein n=1 Tax=Chryseobacterium oryctis TaxID=2952618 RepID=A0ABT3HLW7_9FLAO|nr:hypothetical protein [Chryseobacterium oryctis]MCW3160618.1 hypothetical protein [Chryseobacterium oryctis]